MRHLFYLLLLILAFSLSLSCGSCKKSYHGNSDSLLWEHWINMTSQLCYNDADVDSCVLWWYVLDEKYAYQKMRDQEFGGIGSTNETSGASLLALHLYGIDLGARYHDTSLYDRMIFNSLFLIDSLFVDNAASEYSSLRNKLRKDISNYDSLYKQYGSQASMFFSKERDFDKIQGESMAIGAVVGNMQNMAEIIHSKSAPYSPQVRSLYLCCRGAFENEENMNHNYEKAAIIMIDGWKRNSKYIPASMMMLKKATDQISSGILDSINNELKLIFKGRNEITVTQ